MQATTNLSLTRDRAGMLLLQKQKETNHMTQPVYNRRGLRLWTPQEIKYLSDHIGDGYDKVAAALGRSRLSVIQQYSILVRSPKNLSPSDITAIRKMRWQKIPIQKIAEELDLTVWMVRKTIKQYNL